MELQKLPDGWWITDPDADPAVYPQGYGPYATKAEAENDRRGMLRFEKYRNKPGFITCDPKRSDND